MAELKATLIKESVYHCVSQKESNKRLTVRPPRSQEGHPTRYTAWEKSLKDLSDDANTAMGTLMALFDPDCNAHRELAAWYDEDLTANAPSSRKRRKDYNFRNTWSKFHELYRPNKEVNLDTILKRWEALTDEEISFATFQGQYFKLIKEMEVIGQPPTDTKRGFLILNPSTEAVQVRLDCVKLELTEQMLHSYYDSRLRLSDARPPIVRIRDAKIDFESFSELEDDLPEDPMKVSWQDLDGDQLHGDASKHDSSVATSGASFP